MSCRRTPVAQRVAARYNLAGGEAVTDLRTSVQAGARVARIDQQVARIMEKWSF